MCSTTGENGISGITTCTHLITRMGNSTEPEEMFTHESFSTGEVIFLVIIFSVLVIFAVVGNAVVCILLRLRFISPLRYLSFVVCTGLCDRKADYRVRPPPGDPWLEECPSSQHECSCGKTCTAPGSQGNSKGKVQLHAQSRSPHRYVIFTTSRRPQPTPSNNNNNNDNNSAQRKGRHKGFHWFTTRHSRRSQSGRQSSSITSLFLFNLSLADLLMAMLCIPVFVVTDLVYLWWPLGENMCKVVPYAQGVSVFVSALTHVLISCDRFVLVFFPLRPRMSHRSALALVVFVWSLACIIPLPMPIINRLTGSQTGGGYHCFEDWSQLFPSVVAERQGNTSYTKYIYQVQMVGGGGRTVRIDVDFVYTILLMVLQYFIPLGFICSTYAAIAVRVMGMETPGEQYRSRDLKLSRARRKMVKMLSIVALMYGLSQLPRLTIYLYGQVHRSFWSFKGATRAWAAAEFARDLSTCYNPLIYAWANKIFRRDAYQLLRACHRPCPCANGDHPTTGCCLCTRCARHPGRGVRRQPSQAGQASLVAAHLSMANRFSVGSHGAGRANQTVGNETKVHKNNNNSNNNNRQAFDNRFSPRNQVFSLCYTPTSDVNSCTSMPVPINEHIQLPSQSW